MEWAYSVKEWVKFVDGKRELVKSETWIKYVIINMTYILFAVGVGSTVPHEGFIILESLFVCPMLGCRHSLLRLSNFTFFLSGMHIFLLVYTCLALLQPCTDLS